MTTSSAIQAITDKYTLMGARDPDTGDIHPVQIGDTTVLGLATQLYVWNTDTLVWDKMTQPSITADTINVASTPDTSDLSTDNSTTAQLGIDGVWTGTGEDMLGYAQVAITIHSDVSSTDGGVQFQFSMDNSNWDDSYNFYLNASDSTTRRFQFPVCARYFRVKYTNGGTGTADFRIQTILHRGNILTSIHDIDSVVVGDRSCQLVKSVIVGETTAGGGGYFNVKVNPSGALTVEATSDDAANFLNTELNSGAIKDAVEIIDDWDESDRAKVNLIAGQAGIAAGAGAVGATVPRVTLASDDPLLVEIQDSLADYFFSGYVVAGTAVYVGYEDKAGAYYVQYIETSTGVATYAVGSGGIVAPGSYSGLDYGSFESKF
jgi:hypothetical protein